MAITKEFLSESVGGGAIVVNDVGVDVHTAGSDIDEVWLWVSNPGLATVALTVDWGGDDIIVGIPGTKGLVLIAPGLPVTGLTIRAQTDSGTAHVVGYVNRIS